MPIYEYNCGSCRRKVSIFFPNFSAAETRTAAGENRCPRCGSVELTRVMSRAYSIRPETGFGAGDDFNEEFNGLGLNEMDAIEGMGGMGGMGGADGLMGGVDEEDPRAIARWARQMKENLGPEADFGPEFDQALSRIERGEDPERVMEDYDPEAIAAGGAGEADNSDEDGFDSSGLGL